MIKNKRAIIGSAMILCVCLYLFFPFPDDVMFEATSAFMSFPITNQDGYVLLGIIGSVFFISALILLASGLKKYRIRTIIIVVIVYAILPSSLITIYQETFASGVEAISYDENGECDLQYVSEDLVNGTCNLSLYNRSNEAVTFEMEFLDSRFREDDLRSESLMNIAGPYTITIKANHQETIELNKSLNLSDVPNHKDAGIISSSDVHLKLIDDGTERIL